MTELEDEENKVSSDFWDESRCKRCGICCYITRNGRMTDEICPFLAFLEDGTTECTIYKERLGRETVKGHMCVLRRHSRYDYPDCPYNTNKPIIKMTKGQKQKRKKQRKLSKKERIIGVTKK